MVIRKANAVLHQASIMDACNVSHFPSHFQADAYGTDEIIIMKTTKPNDFPTRPQTRFSIMLSENCKKQTNLQVVDFGQGNDTSILMLIRIINKMRCFNSARMSTTFIGI